MGWPTRAIAQLKQGEAVTVRPRGRSMAGKIANGQAIVVRPLSDDEKIRKGDVVLCRVHGREFLHLVLATSSRGFLIGNNRGHINGWIGRHSIFGRALL